MWGEQLSNFSPRLRRDLLGAAVTNVYMFCDPAAYWIMPANRCAMPPSPSLISSAVHRLTVVLTIVVWGERGMAGGVAHPSL